MDLMPVNPVAGPIQDLGEVVFSHPVEGSADLRPPNSCASLQIPAQSPLFKTTALTERLKLEFRGEFFNVLNHANFSYPSLVVFSGGAISPSAGVITNTATASQQIQFGLKIAF